MTQNPSCAEFLGTSLSRRRFLGGLGLATGTAVATSVFGDAFRQTAFAQTVGGNALVVLSLRGGIDGLGWVVPHGDPGYLAARPRIGVPTGSLLHKDEMFGLHPRLAKLGWLFESGELAAVQAVGMRVPNRSHFSAMEAIEAADPASPARQGWVNRMVGLSPNPAAGPSQAMHLSSTVEPTLVAGPSPTLALGRLRDVSLQGADPTADNAVWSHARTLHLDTAWRDAAGPLGAAGRSALATVGLLAPLARQTYKPHNGVTYPNGSLSSGLSAALADTAQLIRADVGAEVVSIDFGSWDMHADYGTLTSGRMNSMTGAFADALNAFMRDLGDLRSRVTVVTISEFGRRVAENGNQGLDHGWGNMMLVAGAGVRGGRYYGSWPGLGQADLAEGDLAVTTDYRDVLGEVVQRRLNRSASTVFPGLSHRPLGIML